MLTTIQNKFCVVFRNRRPLWAYFLHISRGNEKRDFKGKRLNFIPAISSDTIAKEIQHLYILSSYQKICAIPFLYIRRNTKKEKNEMRSKPKAAFSQINARP